MTYRAVRAVLSVTLLLQAGMAWAEPGCPTSSFDLERYQKEHDYYDQLGSEFSGVKSQADIEKWMLCRYGRYVKNLYYSPPARKPGISGMLDGAQASFNVPKNMLTCIVFVESNFDPRKLNKGSGASGLGQIMNSALDQVNKILGGRTPFHDKSEMDFNAKWEKRKDGILKEKERCLRKSKAEGDCDKWDIALTRFQDEREVATMETIMATYWRSHWDQYLKEPGRHLDDSKVEKLKKGVAPDDRFDPEVGVALMGMYMKYLHLLLGMDGDIGLKGLSLMAGAYNAGPAPAARKLCKENRNFKRAIASFGESYKGAGEYMGKFQTCMRKDCWGYWDSESGGPVKTTDPSESGKCKKGLKEECK